MSKERVGDYYIGVRRVLTNLFGNREALVYVTSTDQTLDSRCLIFSTIFPHQMQMFCARQDKSPLDQTGNHRMQFIPMLCYAYRWDIEVSYYEQKLFWSLCSNMVHSCRVDSW